MHTIIIVIDKFKHDAQLNNVLLPRLKRDEKVFDFSSRRPHYSAAIVK